MPHDLMDRARLRAGWDERQIALLAATLADRRERIEAADAALDAADRWKAPPGATVHDLRRDRLRTVALAWAEPLPEVDAVSFADGLYAWSAQQTHAAADQVAAALLAPQGLTIEGGQLDAAA